MNVHISDMNIFATRGFHTFYVNFFVVVAVNIHIRFNIEMMKPEAGCLLDNVQFFG